MSEDDLTDEALLAFLQGYAKTSLKGDNVRTLTHHHITLQDFSALLDKFRDSCRSISDLFVELPP